MLWTEWRQEPLRIRINVNSPGGNPMAWDATKARRPPLYLSRLGRILAQVHLPTSSVSSANAHAPTEHD